MGQDKTTGCDNSNDDTNGSAISDAKIQRSDHRNCQSANVAPLDHRQACLSVVMGA